MHDLKSSGLPSLLWLLLSMISSCLNDVFTKYLTTGLPPCQICWFRFVLGSLVLLPMIAYQGIHAFKTSRLKLHFSRGFLLSIAMTLYAYGLTHVEMSTVTVIGFTNPIFVLILASILLKEQIAWPIWAASFLVFIEIILIVKPTNVAYTIPALACLVATIIFSLLDIINKKYIKHEPILLMLFFSNLFASFCILPIVIHCWKTPTLFQLIILGLLGISSNLILYFLLKAFQLSHISFLAPFRYIEFVFSMLFGYLFFQEWPTYSSFFNAGIIIAATCFVAYYQNRQP